MQRHKIENIDIEIPLARKPHSSMHLENIWSSISHLNSPYTSIQSIISSNERCLHRLLCKDHFNKREVNFEMKVSWRHTH